MTTIARHTEFIILQKKLIIINRNFIFYESKTSYQNLKDKNNDRNFKDVFLTLTSSTNKQTRNTISIQCKEELEKNKNQHIELEDLSY